MANEESLLGLGTTATILGLRPKHVIGRVKNGN